jgi:hypothetical protein
MNVLQAFIFVEGSGDKALKEAQEVAKEYKGEVSVKAVSPSWVYAFYFHFLETALYDCYASTSYQGQKADVLC